MPQEIKEPKLLSQQEYDDKLKSEISTLMDNGFTDEDIILYGENFKSRFAVKKKDDTTLAIKVGKPDISPPKLDGALELQEQNKFKEFRKDLEEEFGKEVVAAQFDAPKPIRKEILSFNQAKVAVDNITRKYIIGAKVPELSELEADSRNTLNQLIKDDEYIQQKIVPSVVTSNSKILKDKYNELLQKYNLDGENATKENLVKAENEYNDFVNETINKGLNEDSEFRDRFNKYSNFIDQDFQVKYKNYRRQKELPEWVRNSGAIVEGLYKTFANTFPKAFEETKLGATSVLLQSYQDEIDSLKDEIEKGTLSVNDEVKFDETGKSGEFSKQQNRKGTVQDKINALEKTISEDLTKNAIDRITKIRGYEDKLSIFRNAEVFDEDGLTLTDLGTMIGDQLPQVGLAMLTYGIGNMAQEFGEAYYDSLSEIASKKFNTDNPTKEQLLSIIETKEDDVATALKVGIVVGALERIGAGAQVKALLASKKIMGSVLRGEFKSFVKKATVAGKEIRRSGFAEFLTESTQTVASQLGKTYSTDTNFFDLKEIAESGAQGGIVGTLFPFAGKVAKQSTIEIRGTARTVASKFNQEHSEHYFKAAKINIDKKLRDGEISAEEHKSTIEDLQSIRNATSKIPSDLTPKQKLVAIDLLIEKHGLEKEIQGKDIALVKEKKARINQINSDLEEIKTTKEEPVESTVSEQTNEFAKQLGKPKDISDVVLGATVVKIGATEVVIKDNKDNIVLESIRTDEGKKGKGSAKKALAKIIDIADEQNKTLELEIAPETDATTETGLIKLYEDFGFIKEGKKMVREAEKEESFAGIDKIIKKSEPKKEVVISTNLNDYTVKVVDGEIKIAPKFGKAKPSKAEIKKVRELYLEKVDFREGKVADLSKARSDEQISDIIATESENPKEVAQEITKVRESNIEAKKDIEHTKENAVAEALLNVRVDKESYAQDGDRNKISSINPYYFTPLNKKLTGKEGTMDRIRERAQEKTSEEISINDVVEFIETHRNPKEFLKESKIKDVSDLELKFEELTGLKPTAENLNKAIKPKSQKEKVKETLESGEAKSIKQIAEETKIKEPNIRRIVGVGAKEGTFERVDKGIYILSKDGKDIAFIETGNSLESLPRLAKEGFKADMVFLDIPYNTPGVKGGNRGIEYSTITPNDLKNIILPALNKITKSQDSPIVYMYSNSKTGWNKMKQYNNAITNSGLRVVAQGTYSKTYKSGKPMKFGKYLMPPESVIIFNRSGKPVGLTDGFDITAVAPLGKGVYSTQKSAKLIRQIIQGTTEKGETILDPFAGSGVTGEQAIKTGRKAFLIEKSEEAVEKHIKPKIKKAAEEIDLGDVPFQTESKQEKITGAPLRDLVERLKKTGLAKDVRILSSEEIDAELEKIGVKNKDLFQQLKKGVIITPNGFVYKGVVYLNRDAVRKDTPIHEFGHLWNMYAKENHADIFKKGLDLIKDTEYYKAVQENQAYEHLDAERKAEEALSQAIGEKGVKIVNESLKAKFSAWFKNLFSKIAKGLGIRNLSGTKLANLTLDKYTDLVGAELLAGKKIVKEKAPKKAKPGAPIPSTNIEFVIQQQESIFKAKEKAQDILRNKNALAKDVQKALIDYIDENLNSENISVIQKDKLKALIKLVNKTNNVAQLRKHKLRVDAIIEKLDAKAYGEHIKTLKLRALARQKATNEKINIKLKKKVVKNYLNKVIEKKHLSHINFSDVNSIISAIENATTTANVVKAIENIDRLAVRLETKYDKAQAKLEEKIRAAKEKADNRKFSIKARKTALRDYIKLNLNSKNVNRLGKQKLLTLLNSLKDDITTDRQLARRIKKAEDILINADNDVLRTKINKILDAKVLKVEGGRLKAKTNTKLVADTTDAIKANVRVERGTAKEKREILLDRQEELIEKRDKIYDKLNEGESLTEQEINDLFIDGVSIALIEANTTRDVYKAKLLLNESITALNEFRKSQRILLKEEIDELNKEYKQTEDDWQKSITYGKKVSSKTNADLKAEEKSIKDIAQNFWVNISTGGIKWMAALDELASILDRAPSLDRDDRAVQKVANKIKRGQIAIDVRNQKFKKLHADGIKEIYGSVFKANRILGKKHTLFLDRFAIDEKGEVRYEKDGLPVKEGEESKGEPIVEKVAIDFTVSELLSVWQYAHNVDLLPGLESNGFNEEVLQEIEAILPENVKRHGELLFDLYDQMYGDANQVYKKMYFTDMGKPDFYSGRVYRSGVTESFDDILKQYGVSRNTGYPSQKQRTKNNKPIQPKDVMFLFDRHLIESSHFISYAEVHRELGKLLKSDRIQKAIRDSNAGNAENILTALNKFKQNILERDKSRNGILFLDIAMRNVGRAVLSIKPIIGMKQTASVVNAGFAMPTNLSIKERGRNFTPKELYNSYMTIKNNSDWFQVRYSLGQMESTELGLSKLAQKSKITGNSDINAIYLEGKRVLDNARDMSMFFVKQGDKIGVLGALPVFSSWYNEYSKTMPHKEAFKKALEKFENTADRTQQTITQAGKTALQLNPIMRYVVQFASAPIQNMQNARHYRRQLLRHYKTDTPQTIANNALAYLNYRFVQPLVYTWLTGLMAGSLKTAFGFGDEEPDDTDKSLLSALILGNYGSIPVLGNILKGFVDKIALEKDRTWGEAMSSPVTETINKMRRELIWMDSAKTKEKRVDHFKTALKLSLELGVGFPDQLFKMIDGDFNNMILDKDIDFSVKAWRMLGASYFALENSREKRMPKEKAAKLKEKEKRASEKDEIMYNVLTGVKGDYTKEELEKYDLTLEWQEIMFEKGTELQRKFKEKFKKPSERGKKEE